MLMPESNQRDACKVYVLQLVVLLYDGLNRVYRGGFLISVIGGLPPPLLSGERGEDQ